MGAYGARARAKPGPRPSANPPHPRSNRQHSEETDSYTEACCATTRRTCHALQVKVRRGETRTWPRPRAATTRLPKHLATITMSEPLQREREARDRNCTRPKTRTHKKRQQSATNMQKRLQKSLSNYLREKWTRKPRLRASPHRYLPRPTLVASLCRGR